MARESTGPRIAFDFGNSDARRGNLQVTKLEQFPKTECKTEQKIVLYLRRPGALLGDPESRHVPAFSIAQTAHRLQ